MDLEGEVVNCLGRQMRLCFRELAGGEIQMFSFFSLDKLIQEDPFQILKLL